MPIVVGKLTPQQVAPFGQLLNMYADAAEARDRYATGADAQGLLFRQMMMRLKLHALVIVSKMGCDTGRTLGSNRPFGVVV